MSQYGSKTKEFQRGIKATQHHSEHPLASDNSVGRLIHVLKNGYMKRTTREFLRMLCENRSYGLALMNLL